MAFVAAFLPWYGATVGPFSVSVSGWSAGFSAWAGSLLLTASGVLLVLRRSGASLRSVGRVGPSVLVAGVAALGLLLVAIRWITFPRYHGFDVGARYGIHLALLAGIVVVSAAVVELRASGEQLPWAQAGAPEQTEADAPAAPEE